MILLPLLLSFILGIFILSCICRDQLKLNISLFYPLALGLGLCASALCVFLTLIIKDSFNPKAIIGIHTASMVILAIYSFKYLPFKEHGTAILKRWRMLLLCLPFGLIIYASILVTNYQPFGAWDAWGVWNLKFRFLVLGGTNWTAIFKELHWYTQPDYPLMLPLIHAWIYTFTKEGLNFIPQLTGVLFYLITAFIMMGALAQFIHRGIAVLAGLILCIIPFNVYVGTSQYADVLLSFALLVSLVSVFMYIHAPTTASGILAGLTLGWMSFVKNEGVVCMLILILWTILYLMISRRGSFKERIKTLPTFGITIFLAALPSIFFKIFLAPKNKDIFGSLSFSQMQYFNREGLQTILRFAQKEITEQHWSYCWIFMVILTLLSLKKLLNKEHSFLALFFLSYAAILLLVYLTTGNFDLMWRLENTLPRILFYILPSAFFTVTLWSFRDEKISTS